MQEKDRNSDEGNASINKLTEERATKSNAIDIPSIALPKEGRAIQGYFTLLFITLFLSCSSGSLPPSDYLKWIAEHRTQLSASQQQGDVTTTLTYLPPDWLAVNETSNHDPQQIAIAQKEYEGLEYYRLCIALANSQRNISDRPLVYNKQVYFQKHFDTTHA